VGFPIRKFTDQSLFAAPHDLSQRTTSFIASQRQGIHQIPLRHLIALIANARRSAAPSTKANLSAPPRTNEPPIRLGSLRTLPLVRGFGMALDFLKRPVLLQTHPGVPAVKREPTTEMLSGPRQEPSETRLATFSSRSATAPRPNAFPLHDVRYGRPRRATIARPSALPTPGRNARLKRN
jgi:hypothetical protein